MLAIKVKKSGLFLCALIALLQLLMSGAIARPRPQKELKGFAKVNLRPGEIKEVRVALDSRSFSFYDVKKHSWIAEAGEFGILVGSSSADIKLQAELKTHGDPLSKRKLELKHKNGFCNMRLSSGGL